ncbi:hypothetical protein HK405_000731 [Cladochytrium tenue]|nr:hypothetical protein HK405_000731 [Cladochytrium tenue]
MAAPPNLRTMLRVRLCDPGADAPAIAALYAHHVAEGDATFELVAPSADAMAARLAAAHACVVAVDDQDKIAAFAYLAPHSPRGGYRFTASVAVYVAPTHQRFGLGARLVGGALEALARALGLRVLLAGMTASNEGSIALHVGRLGYREVGRFERVGRKFGRWLDVVYAQKDLSDATATPEDGADDGGDIQDPRKLADLDPTWVAEVLEKC